MKTLKEKSFDVSFCANEDNHTEKLKEEFTYHKSEIERKGKNLLKELLLIFYFYKLAKKEKPDICHNFTIKPCIYGTIGQGLAGVENIYCTITGLGSSFEKETLTKRFVVFLYKISLKRVRRVVFQNPDDRDLFLNLKIIPSEKALLIKSSGVDTEYFKNEKEKSSNTVTITLIARMLYQKGVKEFVESAKILKEKYNNLEFLLVGPVDNQSPSAIKKETIDTWHKEGLVNYLGEREDVKEILSITDIFTLPSLHREGVPKSLLEAGSMSLPLITTNTPGCREVVEDNVNGFFIKQRDSKDLAEKLEILIKDKDLREGFGKASREKIIKEFNEKLVIDKYLELINSSK